MNSSGTGQQAEWQSAQGGSPLKRLPQWLRKVGSTAPTWFVLSAGGIFAFSGVASVLSALGKAQALEMPDPIFEIGFGRLMLWVGLAELVIAAVCLFSAARNLSLGLVAWMSTNFLVYRLGLWFVGWHRPCNCLGNLTDALHISPSTADWITKGVLAFLLLCSYVIILHRWFMERSSSSSSLPRP
jgi:hypothetical protein